MSNYVSQLMQQTGITLSSETSHPGGNDLAEIFSADSSAEEIPLPEEHHQVVVPQPMEMTSPVVQRLPETAVREQPRSQIPMGDRSITEPTVSSAPETPPVLPVSEIGNQVTPIAPEATLTTAPPATSELTVVEQVEIPTAIENLSFPTHLQKQPQQNLKPAKQTTSVASSPEVVEIRQVEPATTPKVTDAMPTPQTYLQVVRDWVAGTPTVREEVREVLVESSTPSSLPQEVATKPTILKNPQPSPLALDQVSHAEVQPPTVQQDFVLSIGSIHLTIAALPPENNPPPITTPQPTPAPDVEPFRLSRHYLRFR